MRRVATFTAMAATLAGASLLLWFEAAGLEVSRAELSRRAAWCQAARAEPRPAQSDAPDRAVVVALPEDQVSKRPEDVVQAFPNGVEVAALEQASVQDVRKGGAIETVTIGDTSVMPRGTVVIMNLWATFCEPCKEELPRLRDMIAASPWGTLVRFVPVHVLDNTEPISAYAAVDELMPWAPHKLVDRSQQSREVIGALTDDERPLFRGELPVTLVLGCQRRVRWVRFGAITAEDEAALKETVDELVAELTTPRCQRIVDRSPRVRAPTPAIVEPDVGPRCGDGRCDRGEQDRCPADCATCGDGSCERERGETPASCPQDCRRLATSTVCEGDECCGDG
ncbi:MAG: hypothetical protein KC636_12805, partial [Myxococcales bacterium]|nr:hypothetical protein [Myxococcales bacterium]